MEKNSKKKKGSKATPMVKEPNKIEISPQLSKQIGEQTGSAESPKRGLYRLKVHTRDPFEYDKNKVHKVMHVAVRATSKEAALAKVKDHYKKNKKASNVRAYHMKTVSENELFEQMTSDELKKNLDYHSSKVLRAHKAGDDEKVVHHLKALSKIKFKLERLVKKEEFDAINESVLNIQQRIKRAQIFRKNQPKIQRMRAIARTRMAQEKQLKKRAYVLARKIVRKRVAGNRGVEYATLSPSDKIAVDTMVDKKVKLIKVLASRLVPRVKQAEIQRLRHVRQGSTGTGGNQHHLAMDFNQEFEKFLREDCGVELKDLDKEKNGLDLKKKKKVPLKIDKHEWNKLHNSFEVESDEDLIEVVSGFLSSLKKKYSLHETLQKKAVKNGYNIEIIQEVFERGCSSWNANCNKTKEQMGFDRVNSFISGGKARELDKDLL